MGVSGGWRHNHDFWEPSEDKIPLNLTSKIFSRFFKIFQVSKLFKKEFQNLIDEQTP